MVPSILKVLRGVRLLYREDGRDVRLNAIQYADNRVAMLPDGIKLTAENLELLDAFMIMLGGRASAPGGLPNVETGKKPELPLRGCTLVMVEFSHEPPLSKLAAIVLSDGEVVSPGVLCGFLNGATATAIGVAFRKLGGRQRAVQHSGQLPEEVRKIA